MILSSSLTLAPMRGGDGGGEAFGFVGAEQADEALAGQDQCRR
jgi:hypothetical protein